MLTKLGVKSGGQSIISKWCLPQSVHILAAAGPGSTRCMGCVVVGRCSALPRGSRLADRLDLSSGLTPGCQLPSATPALVRRFDQCPDIFEASSLNLCSLAFL